MEESVTLEQWLNQPPLPEEIRYSEDGSSYIPIEFIKPKLYHLDSKWQTINFKHHFISSPDGRLICTGSVELLIKWIRMGSLLNMICDKRTLTGSATFDVQKYFGNNNWGQTCLSLCIVAAAKELGIFFGKDLNKEKLTVPDVVSEKKDKKKTDKIIKSISEIKINTDKSNRGTYTGNPTTSSDLDTKHEPL